MSRREEMNALEARRGPGQSKKRKEVVDALRVGLPGHHPRGEQNLDFGGEKQPLAPRVALASPIERADAEAVACQQQLAPFFIEQAKGELAAQLKRHFRTVVLIEMRQQLRVAVSLEVVAA